MAPITVTPSQRSSVTVEARRAALAEAVALDGIAAHESAVADFVAMLTGHAAGVLVDVLADPRQPPVARERALGRLRFDAPLRTEAAVPAPVAAAHVSAA